MKHVLIVEDDPALGEGLRLALQDAQLQIELCALLAEARAALQKRAYDLLLLDVNLPDGSGLAFLRQFRQSSATPVILLTANDTETDVVAGLELGADDYITKPFSLAILRARVNAQLRRGEAAGGLTGFSQDAFSFDFARLEFFKDGRPLELSRTEQKLLRCLVENRGCTLPRARLLALLWPDGEDYVDENALSVTVKRLRDKLEDTPSRPRYIKTVYGVGYSWVADK